MSVHNINDRVIVTDQDIDALELHVQEDSLEEMNISFEQVRRKRVPEDDTIEQLVGETGRLELKDDMDREKFGWEKLLKSHNNLRIWHDGNYAITAGDVKRMMDQNAPMRDQWMKGGVFHAYAELF